MSEEEADLEGCREWKVGLRAAPVQERKFFDLGSEGDVFLYVYYLLWGIFLIPWMFLLGGVARGSFHILDCGFISGWYFVVGRRGSGSIEDSARPFRQWHVAANGSFMVSNSTMAPSQQSELLQPRLRLRFYS